MVRKKGLDEELPKRVGNHALEDLSESRLISALQEAGLFVAQGSDRKDYGTDLQLEAVDCGRMTNVRVHVQLKGTRARLNADGSVSRKVARANLNYLLSHPNSIYVCLHAPTGALLVRYAEEVHSEHQRGRPAPRAGKHVTVRLRQRFDEAFQKALHARALAASRAAGCREVLEGVSPGGPQRPAGGRGAGVPPVPLEPPRGRRVRGELRRVLEPGREGCRSRRGPGAGAHLGPCRPLGPG